MKPFATSNFGGGMNDSPGVVPLGANQARIILNGRLQEDGSVKCRDGTKYRNATAWPTTPVCAQLDYLIKSSDGSIIWYGVDRQNGKIYKSTDYGATWAEDAAPGATLTGPSTSTTVTNAGARELILAGFAGLWHATGTATAEWTVGAGDIPVASLAFVESHGSRLWACAADTQTLYGGCIDDPTCWTVPSGLVLTIGGDGEPIQGLKSIGNALLVFKGTKIAYVDGYGNSDIIVGAGARGIQSGVSVFAKTAQLTPYGLIFCTRAGIHRFSMAGGLQLLSAQASEYFGDLRWQDIMDPYPTRMTVPIAAYIPGEEVYVVALQSSGKSGWNCDVLMRYNLKTNAITFDTLAGDPVTAMMACPTAADDGTIRLVTAGLSGKVRVHDVSGTYTDDTTSAGVAGTAYSLQVGTAQTDFGNAGRKRVRRVAVQGEWGSGGGTMSVVVNSDNTLDNAGVASGTKTLTYTASDRLQNKVARPSVVGLNFEALVTAIPTSGYRPRIAGISLYADPLRGGLDL